MSEDPQLIKRALDGDRGAFDEIVRRYQDGLFRHLLRLGGRPEEAEDLCQEAFIRFYGARRRFDPARPVAPFLFAIATNLWRERARKTRLEEQSLDDQQPAEAAPVAEQAVRRLERGQILAAVAGLQPEQREAVSLYYDQGLSYREIARITRAPMGTVSTRLRRALEALRRALGPEAAGLVIAAGGRDPLGTILIPALQAQGAAPSSLAPAIAHGIAHAAPVGVGLLHGIWTLWKEASLMMKGISVALGLAVVGGATVGVPRLVSAVRPANAEVKQPKQAIMPSIPQGIHLTYRVTSQEFALPRELIERRIASIRAQQAAHPEDAAAEQMIRQLPARSVEGPIMTATAEYWGTMHSLMYADIGRDYCVAYDGRKLAIGAPSVMVPDLIKQPTAERSGIVISKGATNIDTYLPYLGIYQPRMTLFDDRVVLSETTPVPTGEKRVYRYRVPNYIDLAHVLQYDKEGRVTSMTIYAYSAAGVSHVMEEYRFADYATVDGIPYPREVVRQKMASYGPKGGKLTQVVDRQVTFRATSASAEPIPNSFFALSTSRPGAQIQDDRYQITYRYSDPALSIDEASKRAYESSLVGRQPSR